MANARQVLLILGLSALVGVGPAPLGWAASEEPASQPETQTVETQSAAPDTQTEEPAPAAAKKPAFSLSAEEEALKLTDDIKVARQQVKEHPDDPEAHFLMAAAYSRSPYLEKAFNHIKKVKNMLKAKKDFEFIDRTIADYEDLLAGDPENPVILYRLAMGYYLKAYTVEKYPHHYKDAASLGDPKPFYEKAQKAMEKVIELNPKDIWARDYLGYLVSENGKDLTKGIPIWEESLKIDSENNPGAYLLLSQAYLKKGDLQNAVLYGAKGLEIKQRMGMTLP